MSSYTGATDDRDVTLPRPNRKSSTFSESGKPFVRYDGGSKDSLLVIFASDDGLQRLGVASDRLMDGTHSTAQLFSVHVPLTSINT